MNWQKCPFTRRSAEPVFECCLKLLKIIAADIVQEEKSMQGRAFDEMRFGLSTSCPELGNVVVTAKTR